MTINQRNISSFDAVESGGMSSNINTPEKSINYSNLGTTSVMQYVKQCLRNVHKQFENVCTTIYILSEINIYFIIFYTFATSIACGTIFYSYWHHWEMSTSFYYASQVLLGNMYGIPQELDSFSECFTVFYYIWGACLIALLHLVATSNDYIMNEYNWTYQHHTSRHLRTRSSDVVISKSSNPYIKYFINHPFQIRMKRFFQSSYLTGLVSIIWILVGTIFNMFFEKWSFLKSLYFAVGAISAAGLPQPICENGDDLLPKARCQLGTVRACSLGVYIIIGVPLFAFMMGHVAGYIVHSITDFNKSIALEQRQEDSRNILSRSINRRADISSSFCMETNDTNTTHNKLYVNVPENASTTDINDWVTQQPASVSPTGKHRRDSFSDTNNNTNNNDNFNNNTAYKMTNRNGSSCSSRSMAAGAQSVGMRNRSPTRASLNSESALVTAAISTATSASSVSVSAMSSSSASRFSPRFTAVTTPTKEGTTHSTYGYHPAAMTAQGSTSCSASGSVSASEIMNEDSYTATVKSAIYTHAQCKPIYTLQSPTSSKSAHTLDSFEDYRRSLITASAEDTHAYFLRELLIQQKIDTRDLYRIYVSLTHDSDSSEETKYEISSSGSVGLSSSRSRRRGSVGMRDEEEERGGGGSDDKSPLLSLSTISTSRNRNIINYYNNFMRYYNSSWWRVTRMLVFVAVGVLLIYMIFINNSMY